MYAMEDVNDDIGEINLALAGSGLEMDEVSKGMSFGLAFGLDLGSGFSIGLGYDRLMARSEVGDPTGSIEYDLPGNLLRGFGRYSFSGTGKTRGFLEASLGRVTSDGTVNLAATGYPTDTSNLDGSGFAFEGAGGFSYWTSPQIALVGTVGYRYASVHDVEVDGSPIYNQSGDPYSIDYSGAFVRFGLTVALGQ